MKSAKVMRPCSAMRAVSMLLSVLSVDMSYPAFVMVKNEVYSFCPVFQWFFVLFLLAPIHFPHPFDLAPDLLAQLSRLQYLGMDAVGKNPRYQLHLSRRLEFYGHAPIGIGADLLPRHPDPILDSV